MYTLVKGYFYCNIADKTGVISSRGAEVERARALERKIHTMQKYEIPKKSFLLNCVYNVQLLKIGLENRIKSTKKTFALAERWT